MANAAYDLIVIGVGGVGSAALWAAARRGLRVLGLDRFPPGHDRGSSHGRTRIIRQAYFEHPDYVPLVLRAYLHWQELESQCGASLYCETGLLQVGPAGGIVVPGVLASALRHGLDVDSFTPAECRARFPGLHVPDGCQAVFERRAGYLRVEDCVRAMAAEAERHGAELRIGDAATGWQANANGVVVRTSAAEYAAARLIVAGGAWSSELLAGLDLRLTVRRKPVFWFEALDDCHDAARGCPAYLFETPAGVYYGFPRIAGQGVKIAEHTGGDAVSDPLQVDRSLHSADLDRLTTFVRTYLPRLSQRVLEHSVCLYTMSPDEHFIVDRHPAIPQLAFAAGLSGHGFKFAPMLGEAIVDLAIDGSSPLPIGFLGCRRPSLTPPPR